MPKPTKQQVKDAVVYMSRVKKNRKGIRAMTRDTLAQNLGVSLEMVDAIAERTWQIGPADLYDYKYGTLRFFNPSEAREQQKNYAKKKKARDALAKRGYREWEPVKLKGGLLASFSLLSDGSVGVGIGDRKDSNDMVQRSWSMNFPTAEAAIKAAEKYAAFHLDLRKLGGTS